MYNICLYFANGSRALALAIKHNITAWYIHTNKNANFTTENIIRYTE